uniref:NACHT, LRR and PYD domains-containing protein 5 n=1 Tax=Castor canadensis TaxID=51338 RepID=A0A8C0WAW5_CASCN
ALVVLDIHAILPKNSVFAQNLTSQPHSMMKEDHLPFFSSYRLQWCLKDLDKEEFQRFKEILKEKYSDMTICPLPWVTVDNASVERLASLLHEYYMGPLAWAVTINILEDMNLLPLSDKARHEMKRCSILEDSEPIKTDQGPREEEEPGSCRVLLKTRYSSNSVSAPLLHDFIPSDYKAHVVNKFTPQLDGYHDLEETTTESPEMQALVSAFDPDQGGFQPRTVVLHGKPGVGKSALARRIVLHWAQGELYSDMFSYVFLLHSGDRQLVPEASLADLIAKEWPNAHVQGAKTMSQPERLLFVVDGFDNLDFTLRDDTGLCGDWEEKRPVCLLIHSLLRRALVPESCLLITARDDRVEQLKSILTCPRYLLVGGMSVEKRTRLVLEHLPDNHRRVPVLRSVTISRPLFDQCQALPVCTLLCAALQLQEVLGTSRVPTSQTLTGLYATFLFHQLGPRDPTQSSLTHGERVALRGLCQVAAEGLWQMKSVFCSNSLNIHGLREAELWALSQASVLVPVGDQCYTFFHLSLQEFCAALFYVLEGLEKWVHLHFSLRSLVERRQVAFSPHLVWMRRFLFGFMSKDMTKALEVLLGRPVPPVLKRTLLQWVCLLSGQAKAAASADILEAFHCLFETQDKEFVRLALNKMDLIVAAFCLQNCGHLRRARVEVKDIFSRDKVDELHPMYPEWTQHKALVDESWEKFCSVLGTHPSLRQLDLGHSVLSKGAMKTLCTKLRHPACKIRNLIFKSAELAPGFRYLWMMLTTNRTLKHLNMGSTPLGDEDVKVACEALRHPHCALETLRLDACGLSHYSYQMISQVLNIPTHLKSLGLAKNKVTDQGVHPLCDALRNSRCSLNRLILDNCGLTAAGCQVLASALVNNHSLTHLCLSNNNLGPDGVCLLSRSMRLPSCALQRLMLNECGVDTTACGFLAFMLMSNRRLTHLSLSRNPLEDNGIKLLCEAMRDPTCRLQDLELMSCHLSSASCKNLACVITRNKHLRSLDLSDNVLGDSGVVALCEGLKQRDSTLRRLGLEACGLTSECCTTLWSVLLCNQHLSSLNLLQNSFSPAGVTKLCSAFAHPACSLRVIGLWKSQYSAQVRKLLEEAQRCKPHLVIDGHWYSPIEDDRYWWKY